SGAKVGSEQGNRLGVCREEGQGLGARVDRPLRRRRSTTAEREGKQRHRDDAGSLVHAEETVLGRSVRAQPVKPPIVKKRTRQATRLTAAAAIRTSSDR